jgi:hypothetical protein
MIMYYQALYHVLRLCDLEMLGMYPSIKLKLQLLQCPSECPEDPRDHPVLAVHVIVVKSQT